MRVDTRGGSFGGVGSLSFAALFGWTGPSLPSLCFAGRGVGLVQTDGSVGHSEGAGLAVGDGGSNVGDGGSVVGIGRTVLGEALGTALGDICG